MRCSRVQDRGRSFCFLSEAVTTTMANHRPAVENEPFANYQPKAEVEGELSGNSGQANAAARQHQGGSSDRRESLGQAVEE